MRTYDVVRDALALDSSALFLDDLLRSDYQIPVPAYAHAC
jgi:hypothetical protein